MAKLKFKNVKKIKYLKNINYKGCMVYIRRINEIFEYLVVFNEQVFTSYIVMKPEKGKKKLTKGQEAQSVGIIFAGAITTVDILLENPEKSAQNCVKPKETKIIEKETKMLH